MATDYPIEITDPDGSVRIAGLADFTDPDNQPSAGPPFQSQSGQDIVLLEDAAGEGLVFGGDATHGAGIASPDGGSSITVTNGGVQSIGKQGFFVTSPVDQPAAPVTLGDVIDALQTLGLVGT